MICPDRAAWREKLAHRFDESLDEPAQWSLDRAHLETCGECRQQALEIDPTLLFQRLPVVASPVSPVSPASVASEVESMRAAVANLRRANALQAPPVAPERSRSGSRNGAFAWRAAAAVLLASALGSQLPLGRRAAVVALDPVPVVEASSPSLIAEPASISPAGSHASGLLVPGEVGRHQARVYEIGYPEMSVVMVVDKSLVL